MAAIDATTVENFETHIVGNSGRHKYTTTDIRADADASGYYSFVVDRLRQFDVIELVASTGGTATVDLLIVTSATGVTPVTTNTLS
jgi:hypothetical protein